MSLFLIIFASHRGFTELQPTEYRYQKDPLFYSYSFVYCQFLIKFYNPFQAKAQVTSFISGLMVKILHGITAITIEVT